MTKIRADSLLQEDLGTFQHPWLARVVAQLAADDALSARSTVCF